MTHSAKTIGLVGILCLNTLGFLPSASVSAAELKSDVEFQDSPKAIVDEAWQVVHRNYVDQSFNQTDWVKTRQTLLKRNYTNHQQAYAAIRKALQPLKDPYTRFMDPNQFLSLTRQTSGEVTGVGVMLLNDAQTGTPFIVRVLPNSPAEKAGLKAGDAILKVGGQSTIASSAADVAKLLRGDANSSVKVQLERNGDRLSIAIIRDVIQLQAVSFQLKEELDTRIGYIHISEFSRHTSEQVQAAINTLKLGNVDGFVLDLRGNPGGLLDSSIEVAQMWLDRGLIVRTIDRTGKPEKIYARQMALTDLPLVVLVNQSSASSSEILTGALQDNGRAMVIGTKTFGKALVQAVHELADGSGLAVTVAHYYTPNGTDISRTGITPDIQITMPREQSLRLKNTRLRTSVFDQPYQRAVQTLSRQIGKGKGSHLFLDEPPAQPQRLEPNLLWGIQS